MEIYLIRHTTPAVERGVCYGQTDIDVTSTFEIEAAAIKQHVLVSIQQVYSSPLKRCTKLAGYLFPSHSIALHQHLKEINCGEWEMKKWNDIPTEISNAWMNDFVNNPFPGGENYVQLQERVITVFSKIVESRNSSAIVAHGGVLRSIMSHVTQTALEDSFNKFNIHYGCVIRLQLKNDSWNIDYLHNVKPVEKETHKPCQ